MEPLPQHVNPTDPARTASAPYNFIPLPELVVPAIDAADNLPKHTTYANANHPYTGYFDVTLTTLSPTYIRCPLDEAAFDRQQRGEDEGVKHMPEFYYTADAGAPVIPGSSLRGMLRAVLEIVSYGKIAEVTDRALFYRSVDNSSMGLNYRDRMVSDDGTPRARGGFLRRTVNGGTILPCRVARVPHAMIRACAHRLSPSPPEEELTIPANAQQTPGWAIQHRRVWVDITPGKDTVRDLSFDPRPSWQQGILVLSGWAPPRKGSEGKIRDFVFLLPPDGTHGIEVEQSVLDQIEDEDQITQWQGNAFPTDRPTEHARERKGALERPGIARAPGDPGEPVFYLYDDQKEALVFLGRSRLFRLPYACSPGSLVPEALTAIGTIDYAEALFGYAKGDEVKEPQGSMARAYAGRVSVGDARLDPRQPPRRRLWLTDEEFSPRILSTPKPTSFQHYLVQQTQDKDLLKHYGSAGTTIRGFKRYWHQGERTLAHMRADPAEVRKHGSQYTRMKPVDAGVTFRFRIDFENLSPRELGALCWVLHPLGGEREYAHSLGMGKPLGMGAVRLQTHLVLRDRRGRYQSLFDGDAGWSLGTDTSASLLDPAVLQSGPRADADEHGAISLADRGMLEHLVRPFEEHVRRCIPYAASATHLYELRRVAMLLQMMEWPGVLPREDDPSRLENSRSMSVNRFGNEFRERPVLPDPSAFGELLGTIAPPPPKVAQEVLPERVEQRRERRRQEGRGPTEPLVKETTPDVTSDLLARRLREAEAEAERRRQLDAERQAAAILPVAAALVPGMELRATVQQRVGANNARIRLEGEGRGEELQVSIPNALRGQFPGRGGSVWVTVTAVTAGGQATGAKILRLVEDPT